ncbi:MAG: substrate-binding domain-containing protein [Rhodospirillales bacterium]|jgi:molybdate transport system substrate-binding protein|nr:substrate-binding domain-containing protein [Rhodospirillales bacterium]
MRFSSFDFDVITGPAPEDPREPEMPAPAIASPAPIRVLSTLGLMGALQSRQAQLEHRLGMPIAFDFAPTKILAGRLEAGEAAELAILTAEAVVRLTAAGRLGPGGAALAASLVGMAQAPGRARPDIATPGALVATLQAAGSIAYSAAGASGLFFAALLDRLGIAADINAKATIIPQGLTGALVARGETEYAIQQVSELMLVDGIDVIGPLPAELQAPTIFSVAPVAAGAGGAATTALIRLLSAPDMAAAFAATGLSPLAGTSSDGH